MLSTPYTLPCGTVVRGRVVKAAMTEALADDWSNASVELCNLYSRWSKNNNAGFVLITGNIQVDRRYMERPGNVAIEIDCPDPEKRMKALKAFASAAQQDGTLCLAQLSHAGRQSSILVTLETIAPSAVKAESSSLPLPEPRAMTGEEIEDVIARFRNAAAVCKEAGFAGIQLHGAHGYLFSQFLSPRVNQRTDAYGGDLHGRSLLLFEVVRACREAVGKNYCIAVKLNSSDFQQGGFSEDDSVRIAVQLEGLGVDLLEVSGGSYENPSMVLGPNGLAEIKAGTSTELREGYFLVFAERMKASLKTMPLMVTGGFRSRKVMEKAIQSGACQFIGVGRPLCSAPDCVGRLVRGEIDELPRYELTVHVPWYVRWLSRWAVGRMLQVGASQMWMYRNMQRMGEGKPLLREDEASAIADMLFLKNLQNTKARNLLGMDSSTVGQVYNAKPTTSLAVKLAVLTAVVAGVGAGAVFVFRGKDL